MEEEQAGKHSRTLIDMSGQKFGRLTVLFKAGNAPGGQPYWLCWCECGTLHPVLSGNLRNGKTNSCGCLYRETRLAKHWIIHGLHDHPYHNVWNSMLSKCYNPTSEGYPIHGALGIGVHESWQNPDGFPQFLEDMGERPDGAVLGRHDASKDFGPDNCAWMTRTEIATQRRGCLKMLTHNGRTQTASAWARELGITRTALNYRLKHWTDPDEIFTAPKRGSDDWRAKRGSG